MGRRHYLLLYVAAASFLVAVAQTGSRVKSPATRFTCRGRASGYYADVETGCQVYHMCDGLGRQFSYSCPNTTLFQQRMLVCDHWYMVNCTNSESDYDANLLIGQRDKPFVSDADMRLRTPRPDILSVPPNSNYYEGLKEAETKFPIHPDNSIVGIAESISSGNDNDLDRDKGNYRPPAAWSTRSTKRANIGPTFNDDNFKFKNVKPKLSKANKKNKEVLHNHQEQTFEANKFQPTVNVPTPSRELIAPLLPTRKVESDSEESELNIIVKTTPDPVYKFIKRFDPNSPDSIKTTMTKSEIINLNQHLPDALVSSEEDRTPRKNKNFGNNFNVVKSDKKKGIPEGTRFENVNVKPDLESNVETSSIIAEPSRQLLPPKLDVTPLASTTMGPPIYYEWKWAVPALDLEPPKFSNESKINATSKPVKSGKRPFSAVTRSTPKTVDTLPSNTEYNISSYFVPDYVFPLDRPHPGYDGEHAQTSFQVQVSRPGRASYGENPACPQCHPAYLEPGTCEPCVIKRRFPQIDRDDL